MTDTPPFALTRADGLARLTDFAPRAGRAYAARRNTDFGPGDRSNVSGLSPYLRRRLITEQETVAAALCAHGPRAAEKFIQEVFWRTYFKGWLEHRPGVWDAYRAGLDADLAAAAAEPDLDRRYRQALAGETGIACFDTWVGELAATGMLHNHTRMWFASIWVFTLRLPWRLGADLFLRQLLDGDPASNTLSWRWVAGLHTKGKVYVALSANIARHTDGRFANTPGLATAPEPLTEDHTPPRKALRVPAALDPDRPALWLITEEDCRAEDLLPGAPAGVATLQLPVARSPGTVAGHVVEADATALADAAERCGGAARVLVDPAPADLVAAARDAGAAQIVTSYVPAGWVRDWLDAAVPALRDAGIGLAEIRRDWDAETWPHATAGFFKVKKAIPSILRASGVGADPSDLPLFAAAQSV